MYSRTSRGICTRREIWWRKKRRAGDAACTRFYFSSAPNSRPISAYRGILSFLFFFPLFSFSPFVAPFFLRFSLFLERSPREEGRPSRGRIRARVHRLRATPIRRLHSTPCESISANRVPARAFSRIDLASRSYSTRCRKNGLAFRPCRDCVRYAPRRRRRR